MERAMELKHVTKRFGGLVAVNDLNMVIRRHEINALIGPNGAGKTTTINLITGALNPDEGEVILGGDKDISGWREYQVARAGVRRTFQNLKLFGRMTALENVMVGAQGQNTSLVKYIFDPFYSRKTEKELTEKAEAALDYIGLADLRDKVVKDLPYGQQKKLEIARALVASPDILLLDEPATGLNPTERAELVKLIFKIKSEDITILIIEHNMDVIMNISDWITTLNFGTKIAEGTPQEILNNDQVIEAYLGSRYKKNA